MNNILLTFKYRFTYDQNHQKYFKFKDEEFEDTKGVIRIRNSKKYRQHNGELVNFRR